MKDRWIELKQVLKNKIYTITFIGYLVLLLLPLIVHANNVSWEYALFIISVAVLAFLSFSIFALFLKNRKEKIYLIVLFILSVIPNFLVLCYALISNAHIRGEMYGVIFDSNVLESFEYVQGFATWQIICCVILYFSGAVFLLYKSGSNESLLVKKHRILFAIACLTFVGIVFTEFGPRAVAVVDFYKSGLNYWLESYKAKAYFEHRKSIPIDVISHLNESEKHTFVVIIGESLSRSHLQLYGYKRETNPELTKMKDDLSLYKDVITPETYTYPALKKVLTFANHAHPEYYYEKPTIVSLFNSVPFETYWISNQESRKRMGRGQDLTAEEAKHVYWLSSLIQPDGVVIPKLKNIIETDTAKNKMIFVHLMGCHGLYFSRYPSGFNYFDYNKQPIPNPQAFWTNKYRKTIDEYDNAVRYNDFVVASILKMVKERKGESSFVIYFPDHGEEVYDYRDFKGHEIDNTSTYQCEIPFIFWRSEEYKKEVPEIIIDENRPYSTENFIHSLSTLARLDYLDYHPELSLFSSDYVAPKERIVGKFIYEKSK